MDGLRVTPAESQARRTAARQLALPSWALAGLCALVALIGWAWYAGKDLSWDVLNHHLYLPFSLTSGRFATDLLAAGTQSTQHPLGYLPFWLLVTAGLPAWAIGLALTLVHALLAIPLWRLAEALWPTAEPGAIWWKVLALMLALAAPGLLLTVGTSSSDPLGAVLVLFALATALPARRGLAAALVCGALLGIAVVVKPTNVVFVAAVWAAWASRRTPWRHLLALVLATAGVALLLQAPWSWWLWEQYGNPIFPLFNSIFQSPFAPQDAILSSRFAPQSLADWVLRPFVIAEPRRLTHTEALVPDLRPAACVVGLCLLAVRLAMARRWPAGRAAPGARGAELGGTPRADRELLAFTAVAYVGWLATSGNSRYALPLFLVLGVVVVRAVQRALPQSAARVLLGLLAVLQLAYHAELSSRRLDASVAWDGGPYVPLRMPDRLKTDPVLHLAFGTPSFAALATEFARGGAFISATGTMSLPMEGPLGDRLRVQLRDWQGRTRGLFKGQAPTGPGERAAEGRAGMDRIVYRFGLQFDWSDCAKIELLTPYARVARSDGRTSAIVLSSCAMTTRQHDDPAYATELATAERVFSAVEAACPKVFGPRPMVTDAGPGVWHRHYLSSDARLVVSLTDGVFASHFSAYREPRLGSVDDILAGRTANICAEWAALMRP